LASEGSGELTHVAGRTLAHRVRRDQSRRQQSLKIFKMPALRFKASFQGSMFLL
jgi:hypothetical protein